MPAARPRELVRLHARLFADPADPDGLLELLGPGARGDPALQAPLGRREAAAGPRPGPRRPAGAARCSTSRPRAWTRRRRPAVRALIGDLRAAGRTILLTTHELADVERLADHVVVIDRGRLLAAGTPAELVGGIRARAPLPPRDDGRAATRPSEPRTLAGLGAALGGTIEEDGSAGRHRLAGREPDPAGRGRPRRLVRRARAPRRRAAHHRGHAGGALPGADRGAGRERRDAPNGADGADGARGADARSTAPASVGGRGMNGRAGADVLRPGDGRPSSPLARVAAMLEMELRLTSRRLENLFVTLLLPAVLLVFFGVRPDPARRRDGRARRPADRRRAAGHPGDGDRGGRPREPRHLDRLRALLRRPQAPGRLAAHARPAPGREDRHDRGRRGRPGGPPRRPGRRRLRLGPRARLEPARRRRGRRPREPPPSARSGSSSPAPCAPRRRWP